MLQTRKATESKVLQELKGWMVGDTHSNAMQCNRDMLIEIRRHVQKEYRTDDDDGATIH